MFSRLVCIRVVIFVLPVSYFKRQSSLFQYPCPFAAYTWAIVLVQCVCNFIVACGNICVCKCFEQAAQNTDAMAVCGVPDFPLKPMVSALTVLYVCVTTALTIQGATRSFRQQRKVLVT